MVAVVAPIDYPYDTEAEKSLLRALLRGEVDPRVLQEDLIYLTPHWNVYLAALEVRAAGQPTSTETVSALLKAKGEYDGVGGDAFFAALLDRAADDLHAVRERLRKHQLVRAVMRIAIRIADRGSESLDHPETYARDAAKKLNQLANQIVEPGAIAITDAMVQTFEEVTRAADTPHGLLGASTGFAQLDRNTGGLKPGDFVLIGGRPNMGKTKLALNMALNVARLGAKTPNPDAVLIISLEESAQRIGAHMLCATAEINTLKYRTGRLTRDDWPKLTQSAGDLTELPIFIDDTPWQTLSDIRDRVEAYVGLALILILNVHLIRPERRGETREREMTEISRGLKRLAKEKQCALIGTAHLNRGPEARTNKDARPRLSDLRDSGALEEDADLVLLLYRAGMYDSNVPPSEAELIVAKQRSGPTGMIPLTFTCETGKFDEVSREEAAQRRPRG